MIRWSALLLVPLLCSDVRAQEPLRELYSPNNFVRSAAIAVDTLYIGGDFTAVAPTTGQAAVLDPTTGLPDFSQARVSGEVDVILPDGTGGWYVAGDFEFAGGQPRRNLAHVLADGSLDADFAPDPRSTITPFFTGFVEALTLSSDGQTLYVGGRFTDVGGQPRLDFAAVNAQTGAVLPFRADLTSDGFRSFSSLLYVPYADGSGAALYVGGYFSAIGGVPRAGIAAVDAVTGNVLPWDPQPETDDSYLGASKLRLGTPPGPNQPGTLYFGSRATRLRGQTCRTAPAEVTLADPQTGNGGASTGFCIDSFYDDVVVVGDALFTVADYLGRGVIQRIDRTTGAVTPFFGGAPFGMSNGGGDRAIAYDPVRGSGGGVLYVNTGRDGTRAVGRGSVIIGVDALTGQRVGPEIPIANARTGLGVIELAVEPGGRLFAGGGDFASVGVGGEDRRFLAGLDLTTGGLVPLRTDFMIFSSVEDVAVSPDERTLYFTTFNGIGVVDLTTGEITTFPTGGAREDLPNAEAPREATADTTSGRVQQGARSGPVGTRADGRPLAPFAAPTRSRASGSAANRGGQSRVRTNGTGLVVTDDRLYVHSLGGAAAYDRDTAARIWARSLPSFDTDPNFQDALLIEAGPPGAAGDTLFLAGSILSAGGQPRDRFAALDAETGAVLDWNLNPTEPGNGTGTAIAVLGSRVYVTGDGLDIIGGEPRDDIAAADVTTGAVLGWTAQDAGGPALAVQPGPGGGVAGGVVYTRGRALDAETGARIGDWALEPVGSVSSGFGGGAFSTLVSERHERVILTGTFVNSQRGSGHAFVTALTPARPFAVAGEPGATEAPRTARLTLAGPNPLRNRTALALSLPEAQAVEASLYDVLGRRVAVLHTGPLPAGVSRLDVDASTLPAGVYVARVVGTSFTEALRLTVVR